MKEFYRIQMNIYYRKWQTDIKNNDSHAKYHEREYLNYKDMYDAKKDSNEKA